MTEVGDLLHLQSIDTGIAAANSTVAELEARLRHSPEMQSAEARLEEALAVESEVGQNQRRLEAAIEDVNAKIRPDEKRLYDGSVSNPKELTAIGQEVEHLKQRREVLEDELLLILDRAEAAATALAEARAAHDEASAVRAEEVSRLTEERSALTARLEELQSQRRAQREDLSRTALALYDRLLERKAGVAVATVRNGACQGCRVTLPDAVRRKAATSPTPVQCPNCERVLSVGGQV